jgi:hypothetical protein
VHITRGLFTSHRDDSNYSDADLIENYGAQVDYLAFSDKAVEQIK